MKLASGATRYVRLDSEMSWGSRPAGQSIVDSLARLSIASKTHMVIFVVPLRFFHCSGETWTVERASASDVARPEATSVFPCVTAARAEEEHAGAASEPAVLPEQPDVATRPRTRPRATVTRRPLTGGCYAPDADPGTGTHVATEPNASASQSIAAGPST